MNPFGGILIKVGASSNTTINVLEIREESIEEQQGYLATKIGRLKGFFSLVFGKLEEEKIGILEEKLVETYRRKGITFDDNSLYKYSEEKINIKPIFKESKDMPILEDFYNVVKEDPKSEFMKQKLYPFIYGSLKFLNNYTNVELENKLIVADIYELGEENIKFGMYIFTDIN